MAYLRKYPIGIIQGGTNRATSTTTYGVVCGGTTSTGTLQTVSSLGSSGQIITSNGSSSLPSWTTKSAHMSTINGNSGSATGHIITLTGSTNGASYSGSGTTLTKSMNYLKLPTTTSSNGQIKINSTAALHADGTSDIFLGISSGNFTTTGNRNSAFGQSTLNGVTSGSNNVVCGSQAGGHATFSGSDNVFVGGSSGNTNTSKSHNIGIGYSSLNKATALDQTVAIGAQCLQDYSSGAGPNTSIGYNSLGDILTGTNNICIGYESGSNYTSSESSNIQIGSNVNGTVSESNVLRIGNGTGTGTGGQLNASYISGIQTIVVTGTPILVSSSDQLGIAVSSARFKENIEDMGDRSSDVLKLQPVTFNYKNDQEKSTQHGLIAEDVADHYDSLVVYGKDGLPMTVKYHDLPALLLNELQKLIKRIEKLEAELAL